MNDIKMIFCACGCGEKRPEYDNWGNKRKYISGHNMVLGEKNPNYGNKASDETRKKISLSKMGHKSWSKGLTKETNESVRKISESKKGISYEEMHGVEKAKEIKRKVGIASKLRNQGKDNPMYGQNHTKEVIEKLRIFDAKKEKEIIKKYKSGKEIKELGKEYDCAYSTIYTTLKRNNIDTTQNVKQHMRELGLANKGKIVTAETREKQSLSKRGEKAPNWRDGKSFEPYSPDFNPSFKRAIRKRDNQVCMACGIHREKVDRAFDVHHINYDKILTLPQNCVSLCRSCHSKTNMKRKHLTKFFQDILAKEYDYKYSEQGEVIVDLR